MSFMVLHKSHCTRISIIQPTIQDRDIRKENFIDGFYLFFKSWYLKYTKYIESEGKFGLSISNEMWRHVFWSKVGSCMYIYFDYVTGLYFFILVCGNYPLTSKRGGGVGIYCQLIPNWIESNRAQILFPSQCILEIHNQIWNTTWRSI